MSRWIKAMLAAVFVLLSLAGTAQARSKKDKALDQTLMDYAATLRWSGFEQGLAFIDPAWLKEHPISGVDLARYRHVRVSYYHAQSPVQVSKTEIRQLVEIGVINQHTQSERSVIDRQTWRWDEKGKRWWLMSGPPDLTQRN
ncbi:hypothetical protein [Tahibacter amnicola]|uniref:Uncharacterized protein n=1 Tax=Tahibacter amnicola TaxID=2976241 RepID=A0ABY6BIW8_9GAMM|nr:hypothetical protein [Tahibacter amnicola]UXI68320.1 hypothetical protein N4264_01330 [Tahibacter amnicola]